MSICAQDSYNREVENSQLKLLYQYSKVLGGIVCEACCWRQLSHHSPGCGNRVADENSQFTVLLPISWIYHWYDTVCRCAPL